METREIIIVVGIVVVLLSFFCISIILFAVFYMKSKKLHAEQLKSRILSAEINAVETASKQISREIHDGIGSHLSIAYHLLETPEISKEIIESVSTKINESLHKLENISRSLIAHHMEDFKLVETLHKEIDMQNLHGKLNMTLRNDIESLPLSGEKQLNIFRICQEAMHNAIKHGKADQIEIGITRIDKHLKIVIQDNGIGMTNIQDLKNKNGMINMKDRAEFVNAELIFHSSPDKGTKVELLITDDNPLI
jgi:two-component system NarL family sensor kinase